MSGNWQALDDEVARWRDTGRRVQLWWRDDDAADVSAALDRLLALQHRTAVPLALAVVPARATAALAERLTDAAGLDVLQHGYASKHHQAKGGKYGKECERIRPAAGKPEWNFHKVSNDRGAETGQYSRRDGVST